MPSVCVQCNSFSCHKGHRLAGVLSKAASWGAVFPLVFVMALTSLLVWASLFEALGFVVSPETRLAIWGVIFIIYLLSGLATLHYAVKYQKQGGPVQTLVPMFSAMSAGFLGACVLDMLSYSLNL